MDNNNKKSSQSLMYVSCPKCGRRLCKAIPGSEMEMNCPKCENDVLISVDIGLSVNVKVVGKVAVSN